MNELVLWSTVLVVVLFAVLIAQSVLLCTRKHLRRKPWVYPRK